MSAERLKFFCCVLQTDCLQCEEMGQGPFCLFKGVFRWLIYALETLLGNGQASMLENHFSCMNVSVTSKKGGLPLRNQNSNRQNINGYFIFMGSITPIRTCAQDCLDIQNHLSYRLQIRKAVLSICGPSESGPYITTQSFFLRSATLSLIFEAIPSIRRNA